MIYIFFPHCLVSEYTSSSIKLGGDEGKMLLDYSKNIITEKTMKLLFDLVSL